jgi:hypothetical protein
MIQSGKIATAALLIAMMVNGAQAGWISAIKDKVTGGPSDEEQQAAAMQAQAAQPAATPAPAEGGKTPGKTAAKGTKARPNIKVVEGTPTPVANAQPTPDKETIRKGAAKLQTQMEVEKIPSNLFQNYVGKWKGDFWVYKPTGQLEQNQAASIEYTLQPDGTLKMESFFFDRISKSWVIAETATYVNEGSSVRVTIRHSNNSVGKQTGHYNDGQLFLTADINDGVEHYRERIDGKRLLVDGFGVYKGGAADAHVFIGRFLRER